MGVVFDAVLRARLLGALEVELDGAIIHSPAAQRPWALFAYLALSNRPVTRAELAGTFWPDVLDQSARASLRSALWALRRQLKDAVVVEGDHVTLASDEGLWTDLAEFERRAATDPGRALELCRGDLLDGLQDEWALSARERHRERVIELLERLGVAAEQRGADGEAIALTREQVQRAPLDEAAHRRLMGRLNAAGDRAGALRAYEALAGRLRRELAVAPSPQTRELAAELRAELPAPEDVLRRKRPLITGLLPLIGRDAELAELRRCWQTTIAGAGAVALIRGEAGVGKTRLATELQLHAVGAGGRAAASAALDLGGTAPLSLWAELIRDLLPTLPAPPAEAAWPDDLVVLTPELPEHFARRGMPPVAVVPDLQRTRLFEAVVALLDWAARETPLLLVLDDIHAADASSLELAGYAARRAARLPVMILLTRRELPERADADRLEQAVRSRGLLACELDLRPLPPQPVARLARAAASLNAAEVRRVVENADGNALLAVETARALGRGEDTIAPSLRGSARAALAPLASDLRRLVEFAAVAARPVGTLEVDQLGLGDPHELADAALQTGLLVSPDGEIAFRHSLLRDAVYQEIAPPRRRGLHQRWARAMVARELAGAVARPAEVARHLQLAGADGEAVPHLARAAADAWALGALDEAVAYLEAALAIAPERADLMLELGELEAWRSRSEQSEKAFARALQLLEEQRAEPLDCARAWLRRARVHHGPICMPKVVLESAERAIEILEQANLSAWEERSEALAASAWAEAVAGDVVLAERRLAQLTEQPGDGDDLRIYDVNHALAYVLMRRGRFVESYDPSIAAGEAIARADRPDLSYGCWVNAAGAAAAAGDPERALHFLDRGMDAIEGQGLRSIEVQLLGARSFVLRTLGRLAQAREEGEGERALAEQLGDPALIAMASHDRGLVALQEGDYEAAMELLEASLAARGPISRPLTRLALAEALARAGRADRATEEVRATALEPVRASDFPESLVPRMARVQGLIAFARGQYAEAERRLEESIAGWERLVARSVRAESIASVLADLGRPVVGLVEPERELAHANADLEAIREGGLSAVVP